MKPRRPTARHHLSRDAERLIWLAQGLAESGSRLEDLWWESELIALIDKLLRTASDENLNQAMDRLHETQPRAYELLADLIEAGCELQHQPDARGEGSGNLSRLVIAIPVLAWSRYGIPTRTLPKTVLDPLRAHLSAHVLAAEAQVYFADFLFSPDQLPQGYGETRAFAARLWQAAGAGNDLKIDSAGLAESQNFVSDVRYLLAVVQVRLGAPVFRWNEPDGNRTVALAAWRTQAGPNLQSVLTGCAYELLLPDAYFSAWRKTDQETRPFAVKSACAYLQTLLGVPASELRAVIAPYFEHGLEEWRIGFTRHNDNAVVHGVTWPLLGNDEEGSDIPGTIQALLQASGVTNIQILDTRMPLEYCDDCGAPLFPNPEGENVHTEQPEESHTMPTHLH